MSDSDTVLRLENVQRVYSPGTAREVQVLRGASVEIHAGEMVALMAPSGAGKSTLLHIAGLLDRPDAGEVWLGWADMGGRTDRQRTAARRSEIGFVYQFHHLLPEFTAAENIALPQMARGQTRDHALTRAKALLAQVGLKDRADHRPSALSGGEQQRVAIARALANTPSLLLADEPTGNLDPKTSDQVFEMLMGLVREAGMAALIATHNPDLARRMDRIVRLDQGRIFEQPASVF